MKQYLAILAAMILLSCGQCELPEDVLKNANNLVQNVPDIVITGYDDVYIIHPKAKRSSQSIADKISIEIKNAANSVVNAFNNFFYNVKNYINGNIGNRNDKKRGPRKKISAKLMKDKKSQLVNVTLDVNHDNSIEYARVETNDVLDVSVNSNELNLVHQDKKENTHRYF